MSEEFEAAATQAHDITNDVIQLVLTKLDQRGDDTLHHLAACMIVEALVDALDLNETVFQGPLGDVGRAVCSSLACRMANISFEDLDKARDRILRECAIKGSLPSGEVERYFN